MGIGALASAGLLSLLLFATQCNEPAAVLGSGLALSAAMTVVGGSLGFLFGIPRATGSSEPTQGTSTTAGVLGPAYTANTNLEQVSDWLTKLLIGAGLTQIGSLAGAAGKLLDNLAPALGGRSDSKAFAAALILNYLFIGFLTGWLSTRLLLASALSHADRMALESFIDAQTLSDTGNVEAADQLRTQAMQLLGLPTAEAERYDKIRQSQPRGSERTASMQELVDAARETAVSMAPTAEQVAAFYAEGSDGQRIYALALMQGDPALVKWSCVLDALEHSRSAFEQYQALVAAESALRHITAEDRLHLRQVLYTELQSGWIGRSKQRREIAQRIMAVLDAIS